MEQCFKDETDSAFKALGNYLHEKYKVKDGKNLDKIKKITLKVLQHTKWVRLWHFLVAVRGEIL
jgi:hypothetical protein